MSEVPRHYEEDRRWMVHDQLEGRDIRDRRVLRAMLEVPRHLFVPPEYHHLAYADGPLPIGDGQTISQPYIVALMTQMLGLLGHEKVLEIGAGSGYQAAVLSRLAEEVHTVERHADLADRATRALEELSCRNVWVHFGDGSLGWPQAAPYDAILVSAAAPRLPPPLLDQLADLGRIVLPVGRKNEQVLEYWQRRGSEITHEETVPVAFVPLRGEYGWEEYPEDDE